MWEPDKIQAQWDAARSAPEAGMVTCDFLQFSADKVLATSCLNRHDRFRTVRKERLSDNVCLVRDPDDSFFDLGMFLPPSAVMVKRDVIIKAGSFTPGLQGSEDMECFWRVLKSTALLVVERDLMRYRMHPGQMSADLLKFARAFVNAAHCATDSPERYPDAAVRYFRRKRPGWMRVAGRMLLHQGEMRQARPLLWNSMIHEPRPRTAAYWLATWFGSTGFRVLHRVVGKQPAR